MTLVKTDSSTAEWVWDDDSGYFDDHLDVVLVARKLVDARCNPFLVCIGENQSGRCVWWATGRIVQVRVVYTGDDKYNRWSGRGDDDWQRAADDAEWWLRGLGFRQETA